jgi:uncharacterized membrane-anchored protein YjiN (DUF445 family)
MKRSKRHIASIILLLVTIGFLASYPFKDSFLGGLLTALFHASMIGGFADWFGITALFRKPLAIPFKTEIIPKSRDRIFTSLSDMVEKELLSKDMLLKKLDSISISENLLTFLKEHDGRRDLILLLSSISSHIINKPQAGESCSFLDKIVAESAERLEIKTIVDDALDWIGSNPPDEKLISEFAESSKKLLVYPPLRNMIEKSIEELLKNIKANAEKESAGKKLIFKLVLSFMDHSDYTASHIADRIIMDGIENLSQLKNANSSQRKTVEKWGEEIIQLIKNNKDLQDALKANKTKVLRQAVSSPYFTNKLSDLIADPDNSFDISRFIEKLVDKLVYDFEHDKQKQKELDSFFKKNFSRLIDEKHSVIGDLVRQKLDLFSNDMLVEIIEEKTGDDLQIIRINGSLVGGLTGVAIYLLTFWINL